MDADKKKFLDSEEKIAQINDEKLKNKRLFRRELLNANVDFVLAEQALEELKKQNQNNQISHLIKYVETMKKILF